MKNTTNPIFLYLILLSLTIGLILIISCPSPTSDGSSKDGNGVEVKDGNHLPVANAGQNKTIYLMQFGVLDGRNSYDPDGDNLSFLWEFISVDEDSSLDSNDIFNANKNLAYFNPDVLGSYQVRLTVNDGETSDSDEIAFNVVNTPPIANAGEDQPGEIDTTVDLNGGGSYDFEGGLLNYTWEFFSLPVGSALTNNDITGRYDVAADFVPDTTGDFILMLTVVDDASDDDTDEAIISVLDAGEGLIDIAIE